MSPKCIFISLLSGTMLLLSLDMYLLSLVSYATLTCFWPLFYVNSGSAGQSTSLMSVVNAVFSSFLPSASSSLNCHWAWCFR